MENVDDRQSLHDHQVVGQKAAMTPPPDRLRTHHGDDVMSSGQLFQSGDPGRKLGRRHVVGVRAELRVPPPAVDRSGRWLAPSTQCRHPAVPDPGRRKPPCHLVPCEMWIAAASGIAPHIDHEIHAGSEHHVNEPIRRKRAVPNRMDGSHELAAPLFVSLATNEDGSSTPDVDPSGEPEQGGRGAGTEEDLMRRRMLQWLWRVVESRPKLVPIRPASEPDAELVHILNDVRFGDLSLRRRADRRGTA